VLLVYFSGHGITLDSTDYLVPSDAYRPQGGGASGRPAVRGLIPVVPADGHETWEAGQLRYSGDGPKPLKCGGDLWWVPGKGGLVADGIKTGTEFFGMVINLRGEHRPQLTVDRRTVRAWDERWGTDRFAESLPELMTWPGFSLSWLLTLMGDSVERAQRVFEYAVSADQELPVGVKRVRGKSRVPLRLVGCVGGDLDVLQGEEPKVSAAWLSGWRTGIWRMLGLRHSPGLVAVFPVRTRGFPTPDPVDGALLESIGRGQRGGRPTTRELASCCARAGHVPSVGLRRLRKYAITGLDLSEFRNMPAFEAIENSRDPALLHLLAPWPPAEEPRPADLVRSLARAAYLLGSPLARVIRRAEDLAADRRPNPLPDLTRLLAEHMPEAEKALESLRSGAPPRSAIRSPGLTNLRKERVEPNEVVADIRARRRPLSEILDSYDMLAPIGIKVASRAAYPGELDAIEIEALGRVRTAGQLLDQSQLLLIAGQVKESIGAVRHALTGLADRGLLKLPPLVGPADFIPGDTEIAIIMDRLPGMRDYPLSPFSSQLFGPFRDEGTLRTRIIQTALHPESGEKMVLAARNLAPYFAPPDGFGIQHIIKVAFERDVTLAGAASALRSVYPGTAMPELGSEFANLTVPRLINASLQSNAEHSWIIETVQIIRYAVETQQSLGAVIAKLDLFRPLGFELPPYNEEIRAAASASSSSSPATARPAAAR
jgi:hypothetical protein